MDAGIEFGGTPGKKNSIYNCMPQHMLLAPTNIPLIGSKPKVYFSEIMYHPGTLVHFDLTANMTLSWRRYTV
jgi:hypothetical protein